MSEMTHAAVHEAPTGFIRKYIFSLDHKVIGIQYFFLALASVFTGLVLSILMRLHLAYPDLHLLRDEQYLGYLTLHGTFMVFFVLTTAPQSGFGNYFLPIQIGAADMAFPVLNMLSFWTTFVAFVVMLAALFVTSGPGQAIGSAMPVAGWTSYPTLSALQNAGSFWGQDLWLISIALFCAASLMGALNFITTTLDLRCKGMSLWRMPL